MEEKSSTMPPTEVMHDKDYSGERDFACENLTLIIAGNTLLEDTTVRLSEGRRYGLVGRNGIGKTCLMSAFARKEFE
jgi:ATPase subunit of ABC transporter with duplicated ATPase domains